MAITLDHVIVPSNDNQKGAAFLARILDLDTEANGHFVAVRVNGSLTLDFATEETVSSQHYAFLVGDDDFDAMLSRIQAERLTYGSGLYSADDGKINHRRGGRRLLPRWWRPPLVGVDDDRREWQLSSRGAS